MAAMNSPLCTVIELRRYRMQAGRRDELIELFEREFIATQQAVGLHVLGIFREPREPERFTWLRGFADMAARAAGLAAFYDGPVWRAHRSAANATIVDSDDVLLLRPSPGLPGLRLREPAGTNTPRPWCAIELALLQPADDALREAVSRNWLPALAQCGAQDAAVLETEPTPNNVPRLPVRSDGPKLVLLAAGLSAADPVPPAVLGRFLAGPPKVLELAPTVRSPLN